jgi:hypothetical protein
MSALVELLILGGPVAWAVCAYAALRLFTQIRRAF